MAEIRPFGGIHYNPSSVKDLTKVLCPPYDVISPVQQQELYLGSDHNFVRIEFGRELPQDSDNDNKYTRASFTLKNWLEKRILQKDDRPGIYIHDQHYRYNGKGYRRRHITCLVKLEEWDRMVIRPHEGTFARAKSDRLSMLWTLQANTSPIMGLYDDGDGSVTDLLEAQTSIEPLLQVDYDDVESHSVRAIRDEPVVSRICRSFSRSPVYIADGHHRYESALTYRRERRFGITSEPGEEPYDFVMMSLVEFNDPGLLILPAHRLLRGVSKSNLSDLIQGLESYFIVSKIPESDQTVDDAVNGLRENNQNAVNIVLAGLVPEYYLHLTLRNDITLNRLLPHLHADYNQKFGVSVVDHLILEGIMGFTPEAIGSLLSYTHDADEAIRLVSSQEYQLAFLVNPVKPSDIKSVADSGDRMPKKST
ncbi:MAG: DUF1015 domain-containing protein, partial [Dehalococcoidia bacterium]